MALPTRSRTRIHVTTGIPVAEAEHLQCAETEHPLAIALPSETTLERASAMATRRSRFLRAIPPAGTSASRALRSRGASASSRL
jgi:hypothetical protein